jgi:hypothetical protein
MLAKTAPQLTTVVQPDVRFSCRVTFDAISGVTRFAFGVHGFVLVLPTSLASSRFDQQTTRYVGQAVPVLDFGHAECGRAKHALRRVSLRE